MLYSGIFIRAACSVLRAACKCESNKGIHSFNFSSVLRAACKYELALRIPEYYLYNTVLRAYSINTEPEPNPKCYMYYEPEPNPNT